MSKTFVIADLHGRYDLMERALERIAESSHSGGTVVFLGDYVDRGPQSKEVIDRLRAGPEAGWRWVSLKGNHEVMMIECHDGQDLGWWLGNGGSQTLTSFGGKVPLEVREWAGSLPMWHEDKHRLYVHAGVVPALSLEEQGEGVMLWMRYPERADIGFPGKHVVHGHTPNLNGPELYSQRTNLDTGAVFGGRLVVGVFDDDKPGGPVSLIEVSASPTQQDRREA